MHFFVTTFILKKVPSYIKFLIAASIIKFIKIKFITRNFSKIVE